MQIKDIMTTQIEFCTPESSLQSVARKMAQRHCGAVAVVENTRTMKPIGIVTNGDITTRVVAKGQNPKNVRARECMTEPLVTVRPETDLAECISIFQESGMRQLPVVDEEGHYCGIVAQDDVLRVGAWRDSRSKQQMRQAADEEALLRLYF